MPPAAADSPARPTAGTRRCWGGGVAGQRARLFSDRRSMPGGRHGPQPLSVKRPLLTELLNDDHGAVITTERAPDSPRPLRHRSSSQTKHCRPSCPRPHTPPRRPASPPHANHPPRRHQLPPPRPAPNPRSSPSRSLRRALGGVTAACRQPHPVAPDPGGGGADGPGRSGVRLCGRGLARGARLWGRALPAW